MGDKKGDKFYEVSRKLRFGPHLAWSSHTTRQKETTSILTQGECKTLLVKMFSALYFWSKTHCSAFWVEKCSALHFWLPNASAILMYLDYCFPLKPNFHSICVFHAIWTISLVKCPCIFGRKVQSSVLFVWWISAFLRSNGSYGTHLTSKYFGFQPSIHFQERFCLIPDIFEVIFPRTPMSMPGWLYLTGQLRLPGSFLDSNTFSISSPDYLWSFLFLLGKKQK